MYLTIIYRHLMQPLMLTANWLPACTLLPQMLKFITDHYSSTF